MERHAVARVRGSAPGRDSLEQTGGPVTGPAALPNGYCTASLE